MLRALPTAPSAALHACPPRPGGLRCTAADTCCWKSYTHHSSHAPSDTRRVRLQAGPTAGGPTQQEAPDTDSDPSTAQRGAAPPAQATVSRVASGSAASTSGSADAAVVPALTLEVLLHELRAGQLLPNAQRAFPKVPWGPQQLAQVVGWSTALGVVAVTSSAQTPQISALGASAVEAAALRHLGLEVLCTSLAVAVLFMGLRRSRPRSTGLFSYSVQPQTLGAVAALAVVCYPLADPVLHGAWSGAEQALLSAAGLPPDLLPDSGHVLVEQLQEAAAAGAYGSLAMHLAASCVVGPLWEETFWRGFFLASMTKVLPLPACVAASSWLFALLHLGPGNLLPIFCLSAVCDLLYLRTASLAAPLAFHAGWNAYQVLGIVLLGKEAFV